MTVVSFRFKLKLNSSRTYFFEWITPGSFGDRCCDRCAEHWIIRALCGSDTHTSEHSRRLDSSARRGVASSIRCERESDENIPIADNSHHTSFPPTSMSTEPRYGALSTSGSGSASPPPEPLGSQAKKETSDSLVADTRKRRVGSHREKAIARLERWRYDRMLGPNSSTLYSARAVLPDTVISALATDITLKTSDDIQRKFNSKTWLFAPFHAEDVLKVLREVDEEHMAEISSKKESSRKRKRDARDSAADLPSTRGVSTTLRPATWQAQSSDLGSMPLSPSRARTQVLFVTKSQMILIYLPTFQVNRPLTTSFTHDTTST